MNRPDELRAMVRKWLSAPSAELSPMPPLQLSSVRAERRMTPLEMIEEWKHGCSNVEQVYVRHGERPTAPHPEDCPECTRALIDALEARLRADEPVPSREAFRQTFTPARQPRAPQWLQRIWRWL